MSTEGSSTEKSSWPFAAARSTGTDSHALLSALLATNALDEISDADDYVAVGRYVRTMGKVDETGKTTVGVSFWLYPTDLHGPYHVTDAGEVKQHGTLVTIQSGAVVGDVIEKAKASLKMDGITHEHIA